LKFRPQFAEHLFGWSNTTGIGIGNTPRKGSGERGKLACSVIFVTVERAQSSADHIVL
jgi:hypothetical protein